MSIIIKNITKDNWEECIKLSVSKDQQAFLPSNAYSLLEAAYDPNIKTAGIYKDETMIGFSAYALDADNDLSLTKFMIDESFQGKGYGKQALVKVLNKIKATYANKEIWLSIHPKNDAGILL